MFHESWGEHWSFDDSVLLRMRKYLYTYVLVVYNGFIFFDILNLCNLSLLAEHNNGSY